jgi:hypothetical protein
MAIGKTGIITFNVSFTRMKKKSIIQQRNLKTKKRNGRNKKTSSFVNH